MNHGPDTAGVSLFTSTAGKRLHVFLVHPGRHLEAGGGGRRAGRTVVHTPVGIGGAGRPGSQSDREEEGCHPSVVPGTPDTGGRRGPTRATHWTGPTPLPPRRRRTDLGTTPTLTPDQTLPLCTTQGWDTPGHRGDFSDVGTDLRVDRHDPSPSSLHAHPQPPRPQPSRPPSTPTPTLNPHGPQGPGSCDH